MNTSSLHSKSLYHSQQTNLLTLFATDIAAREAVPIADAHKIFFALHAAMFVHNNPNWFLEDFFERQRMSQPESIYIAGNFRSQSMTVAALIRPFFYLPVKLSIRTIPPR